MAHDGPMPFEETLATMRDAYVRCLQRDPYLGGVAVVFSWKVAGDLPIGFMLGPEGGLITASDMTTLTALMKQTSRMLDEQNRTHYELLEAAQAWLEETMKKIRDNEQEVQREAAKGGPGAGVRPDPAGAAG